MKTIYDLAIWHHAVDGETYAFPIGAKNGLGGTIYPKLNSAEWEYKGTLPKGMDVTNVKPVTGNRVKCTIAGRERREHGRLGLRVSPCQTTKCVARSRVPGVRAGPADKS